MHPTGQNGNLDGKDDDFPVVHVHMMTLWLSLNGVGNDYQLRQNGSGQRGGLEDKLYPQEMNP